MEKRWSRPLCTGSEPRPWATRWLLTRPEAVSSRKKRCSLDGPAEIGDSDDVGVAKLRAVALERGAGAGEEARIDRSVDDDPRLGRNDGARDRLDGERLRRRILETGDDLRQRLALGRGGEKTGRKTGTKQLPARVDQDFPLSSGVIVIAFVLKFQ